MARARTTQTESIEEEDKPDIDPAEWLRRVISSVCEGHVVREMLPVTEYGILAEGEFAAGADPVEAADRLNQRLTSARDWMLNRYAYQAYLQGWQPGTKLEWHGSMPPNWLTDMMRHSVHDAIDGKSEYFFRFVSDKDGINYPIALPVGPYQEYFKSHHDEILHKFEDKFKKI